MAKDRRNKVYRQKPISRLGGLSAVIKRLATDEDASPIIDEARTDLNVAYWIAFDNMVRGESSEEQWSVVAVALNVALVLAEFGYQRECLPYIVTAQEGQFRAKVRADKHCAWRYDGPAIDAIREALRIHDEQVAVVPKSRMREALAEVHRRVDKGETFQLAA